MKAMKTCKMGCGKMKSGGPVKKVKKMAMGGMKLGDKNAKTFIAGMPNSGPTGPNYQGIDTMKKGGIMKKKSGGPLKPVPSDKVGLSKLPTAVRNKMGYMKKGGVKKMQSGGMTSSTDPKKDYYGLGERELKDNIEKAYKNKQIAVRAKDPVKTQEYQQEFSNNFKTLVENREKLNALKQGLPTKKASEVIKNVGKPKPIVKKGGATKMKMGGIKKK